MSFILNKVYVNVTTDSGQRMELKFTKVPTNTEIQKRIDDVMTPTPPVTCPLNNPDCPLNKKP